MGNFVKILLTLFIAVIMTSAVFATCNISIDNFEVDLRSEEDGYDTSIYGEDNSEVDIRISFEIDNISGDSEDCEEDIEARAEIFRWDDDDDEWDSWRSTSLRDQGLGEEDYVFIWNDEFEIDDSYERYKIEGYVEYDNVELEREEAYIDVENNSCSGIIITTRDFEIDEGEDERETFIINNNTNRDFEIEDVEVSFSGSGVTSGEVDYPDRVDNDDVENIEVTLEAGYTSRDITRTGIIEVSGYLDDEFCSFSEIGEEEFDVRIEDTGSSSSSSSSSSSGDCEDLSIKTYDFTMDETSNAQEIFYLENNSTKRFEILEVEVEDSGLDVKAFFLEKYAFPNNLSNIVVTAESGNVTSNKTYENTLKVRGRFSDGRSCSFSSIDEANFDIIVDNTNQSTVTTCNGFVIDAPTEVEIENAGSVSVTIVNGTNRTASVEIESEMQVNPSVITLPANSSITRDLSINAINKSGSIYLDPTVTGCNVNGKEIRVINTAVGELGSVDIDTSVELDENSIRIKAEFNNPSNKFYVGVVSFEGEGWISEDKIITIPSGQSFTEIEIVPTGNRQATIGKIVFTSNGNTISEEVNLNEDNVFAGLFGLGAGIAGIGILLLIIVVAIIVVLYIKDKDRQEKELIEIEKTRWQN